MKIGLVGYDKAEIESALQAYSVKKFLKEYNVECGYTKKWAIKKEKDKETIEFLDDKVGIIDKDISTYLMINYKSRVDLNGSSATFRDYYQNNFKLNEMIPEALLLSNLSNFDEITKAYTSAEDYILLDCVKENSSMIRLAQKEAKNKKLNLVINVHQQSNSILRRNKDKFPSISDPSEYLGVVKGAKFIITDSFMTLWLAILNRIPFVAQENSDLPGKNKRLLERLELGACYKAKKDEPTFISIEKSNTKLDKKLSELRTSAIDALLDCLPPVYLDKKVQAPPDILYSECCGCYTCKEVCPVDAITMVQDSEGFYYPFVNDKCIDCGLCVKRCVKKEKQQLVEYKEHFPKVICAINNDETVRLKSTSGGVFSVLARYIIEEKQGVVFGVKFNEDMVAINTMAKTMEEVEAFYGSKYIKSEIDGVYKKVKEQLASGAYVLYSGLPCECAGLRAYLNKDYEKLFICEILCHAAPSPTVFKDYLQYISQKFNGKVKNVKFREKSKGWLIHECNMVFEFENRAPVIVNSRRNNYFRNFLIDNISRPGCSKCSFTKLKRVGDVTIGDFWGINRLDEEMHDNKGTSAIMINNSKGNEIWEKINTDFKWKEMTVAQLFNANHNKPMPLKNERNKFFRKYKSLPVNDLLNDFNDLKK